ncbi:hypothetical protein [Nocardia aurantiaca]|uniref:Uncharacterized protein n=1 Tax=Nocardia aurantiaca TaxID=2675850 RepID=A0A6I3KSM9_9NOCA|nr:hypothetical protein [Nocardia aurantiaca]MTE11550.1 hypothetical protein [Nocardia aurantiaca]
MLIAAAVLTLATFWLPVMTIRYHSHSWDVYLWKSKVVSGFAEFSGYFPYFSAVPYVLTVIVAGVAGTLLAVRKGARPGVLFWAAAFASGLALEIASANVTVYAEGFHDDASSGAGFWVITLVAVVALAALVMGLREAVLSKRSAAPQVGGATSGGAADRVAGVFLIVAAAVDLGRSFLPLLSEHWASVTIWHTGADRPLPWAAVQYAFGLIAVIVVAVALLAGAGKRNPAVRAAVGAAAALIFANAINALSVIFAVMGPNFWEYVGVGLSLAVLTLMLSVAATIAGLVAQLARPRLAAPARVGYAPGFMPPPGPNPFAVAAPTMAAVPNPFAPVAAAPNSFAPAAPTPNPFAAPAPDSGVETTVKLAPPPRMAKVYDGKDAEGRPVVDRPAVEGNTRTAVLAYLESAPIVLAARSFEQDEFAPTDRDVPLNFRTDGTWVWAGAVAHYLHKHGLPPEAELVRHIASRGFRVGEVDEAAKDAAVRVITGS